MRAIVLLALICGTAAVTPRRKVDKSLLATPLSKKVATELNVVAKVLQEGVKGMPEEKNHTDEKKVAKPVSISKEEGAKKDKKFPWWKNASDNMPNLTAVKKEANKTEKATEKVVNKTQKDKKFPWWANASKNMPNFTATKKEVNKTEKDKKFPWWANASAASKNGTLPNLTAVKNHSEKATPSLKAPQFTELGPFESKEAACEYCFTSHTRTSVVPNCICTAYDGDNGPTMFCTGTSGGLRWVQEKGGCKCTENNPSSMGQTTCDPF